MTADRHGVRCDGPGEVCEGAQGPVTVPNAPSRLRAFIATGRTWPHSRDDKESR